MGRLSFLAQVAGGQYQDSCHTTNTSCVFKNLPCGQHFNLTVQAQGAQCNGMPSVNEYLETGNPSNHRFNVFKNAKKATMIELIVMKVVEKIYYTVVQYIGKCPLFLLRVRLEINTVLVFV